MVTKNMVMVTLYIPKTWVTLLDDLVREGFYPSRSEAIRIAVRNLLKEHEDFKVNKKKEVGG